MRPTKTVSRASLATSCFGAKLTRCLGIAILSMAPGRWRCRKPRTEPPQGHTQWSRRVKLHVEAIHTAFAAMNARSLLCRTDTGQNLIGVSGNHQCNNLAGMQREHQDVIRGRIWYTCMQTYTYTYMSKNMLAFTHRTYTHVYIYIYIHIYIYIYAHIYIVCVHMYTYKKMPTLLHFYRTHTHTCMHAYVHHLHTCLSAYYYLPT